MSAAEPPTPPTPETDSRSPAPPEAPARRRGVGAAVGAVLLLLAAKAKVLLVALKALKFGKLFITMGSMGVMIAVEAQRAGWWFAVGFVVLILIHGAALGMGIPGATHIRWPRPGDVS